MYQAEEHGAHRGHPGPPVCDKEFPHLGEAIQFHDAALSHICHDDDGHDNLIGRQAQDECDEDDTIQPQEPGERVQKGSAVMKEAGVPDCDVGHDPDNKAGRRCKGRSPPQNKERAVKD